MTFVHGHTQKILTIYEILPRNLQKYISFHLAGADLLSESVFPNKKKMERK